MQKKVRDIIKKVCKEQGVPEHIGMKVHGIPWRVLREETSKHFGNWDAEVYPTVKIPAFGTFATSQRRLNNIKERTEKKNERKENGTD